MTMTSGSLLSLFVRPEVADKADPGVEPASAGVAHVSRLVGLCRNRSVLSRLSLFFGCSDPVALC